MPAKNVKVDLNATVLLPGCNPFDDPPEFHYSLSIRLDQPGAWLRLSFRDMQCAGNR
jgi:hypothetical protein